jgi:glycosyltransferase involved in cell wall biosynthesis
MQEQPLVSIIIPSYNGMPYLEEAIDSVLAQDYPNIELIVLDDGSLDNTALFLQKYAEKFYYESHSNMGQAETLNKGWRMSKGEILGYLSADDKLASNAVSVSVECLLQNPDVVLTYADNMLINSHSQPIRKLITPEFNYYQIYMASTTPVAVGSFFRRSAFDAVGGWEKNYRQIGDYEYHLRLMHLGPFMRIPKVLGYHRIHALSASYTKMSFERADEYKQLMSSALENTQDGNLLKLKNKILSQAYLISGRTHWRSNRYRVGLNYFLYGLRLYPRNIFLPQTYRILMNALVNRKLHQMLTKMAKLYGPFKKKQQSD